MQRLWELGNRFLIVGVHNYETARRQLTLGQQVGFELQVYRFLYFGRNVGKWVMEGLNYYRRFLEEGLDVKFFWLDVEPDVNLPIIPSSQVIEELYTAIAWCQEYRAPHGIYSAKWAWEALGLPSGEFSHLPLMVAAYDHRPVLDWGEGPDYGPFGEWPLEKVVLKQYAGSVRLEGVGIQVDLNVRLNPQ